MKKVIYAIWFISIHYCSLAFFFRFDYSCFFRLSCSWFVQFLLLRFVKKIACVYLNNLINFIFVIKICLTIFPTPISHSCVITLALSTVMFTAPSKYVVLCYRYAVFFLIIYDNYQYVLACLDLWHVFLISHICKCPQYLSYYWCLYIVLHTRIHTLNDISVYHILKY